MCIRRAQTRNAATAECYFTRRLVRSARSVGKVRQATMLNLGGHFVVVPTAGPGRGPAWWGRS